ncbi:HEAT repeat domain-containing protein [Paenibacillus dokdonensis]|uniref:HEAT repeat domain-containing protein n=1 Tax=Paenibacillus dokdonensis TaxID=2567944 RepID=A0ABU6GWF4_9BACL|nr:HEAT repeat domain-containing protein [Paenibacillus dokdonensis]MEC0244071.1 HEAT repeat domain-containing protein [Paenibacillus dokdonensis]
MENTEPEVNVASDLPENYNELKNSANRTANWKERLDAVEELGNWKSQKSIDILKHRLDTDPVYQVQEAAYEKLKAWGEDVEKPVRSKYEVVKGIQKILLRVKKSLPRDHSYEEFKEKLKKMRIDVYNTYEGDKGAEFDAWLEGMWKSL